MSYFDIMFGSKYDIEERCVFETDNFVCVPSIGSFVEGYLLVIPKKHYLSALTMPETHIDEFLSITSVLSYFYSNYYHQTFLVFEHGTSNVENVGGMSVVHAHLHFVPCSEQVITLLNEFDFLEFDNLWAVREYYLRNATAPYLLLKDIDDLYYLAISEKIPSQYFRKKVCDICSIKGTGNWKEYPYIDNIKKTLAAAKQFELEKQNVTERYYMEPQLLNTFDKILTYCFRLFKSKNSDYGPTWLLYRFQSLNDEIWRKAKRIRTLEEHNDRACIPEGRDIEYVGIINYCIMFLIKLNPSVGIPSFNDVTENLELLDEIDEDILYNAYQSYISEVRNLLVKKNTDYGDAWKSMSLMSMTDQVIIRVYRIRKILMNNGKCAVSEGITAQLHDIINYCVFALIKMDTDLFAKG